MFLSVFFQNHMRKKVTLLLVFWGCWQLSLMSQQDDFTITKASEERIYRISLAASNARDTALLRKCFDAHGAYREVGTDASEFHLEVNRTSAQEVWCIISSGRPQKVLKRYGATGSNSRDSLFRAVDNFVQLTSGLRGFFASKLLFIGHRGGEAQEVYSSDLFFGEVKQRTSDKSQAVSPRWHPNGRHIIYTSYYRSGFPDIFIIDSSTSKRVPFATYKGTNSGARYSPDGRFVAMALSATDNVELYLAKTQGKGLKRITRNDSIESSPTWKRDGSELVFTSDALGRPQLFRMSSSGGNMTRIMTNISRYCAEPDWNHLDPNKIVFTAGFREGFQIVLWDYRKNRSEILTRGRRDSIEAVWLRDGRHVVFTRRTGGRKQLMILDSITKQERPLNSTRFGNVSQADVVYTR